MPHKKIIDCLVLTPVGPSADFDHVRDTVESFLSYMSHDRCIMAILDDTRTDALASQLPNHTSLRIVKARQRVGLGIAPAGGPVARLKGFVRRLTGSTIGTRNTRGELFLKQMRCLTALGEEFDWKCMLRLDDDALIIGPNPQSDALLTFSANPKIGMLGAYLRRGDGSDKQSAMKKKAEWFDRQLDEATKSGQHLLYETLRTALHAADTNGYTRGYMCTGGAFFISRPAFDAFGMNETTVESLGASFLDDDLLYSLFTVASGYSMHDFSDEADVMAINWRGLPMPLEKLAFLSKKIVHPVKDVDDADHERRVRAFFRARRAGT